MYFFIPVLTFYHVPNITFHTQLIWLSITPFMVYIFGFIFFRLLSRFQYIESKTEGALIMSSGIGSISFVGFPVFETLYGQEGLSYGLILSLAGTFIVFNTFGISTGLYYSKTHISYGQFLKKLLMFPPLLAFLIALPLNLFSIPLNAEFEYLLSRLSSPFSIIALLTIGMQIDFSIDRKSFRYLIMGQLYKLFIAPLIIYIWMWYIVEQDDISARVCVLGAGIGSMNAVSIVAAQMGLNPKLSSLMPAIGIPVSIPLLFMIDILI